MQFYFCLVFGPAFGPDREAWYLDSGATEHMSGRREWFSNYTEFDIPQPVRIGNGDTINAFGHGDIDALVFNGQNWSNVWYVPTMFVNLFSKGRCLDKNDSVKISTSSKCVVKRSGCIVAVGYRQTGVYKMSIKPIHTQTYTS